MLTVRGTSELQQVITQSQRKTSVYFCGRMQQSEIAFERGGDGKTSYTWHAHVCIKQKLFDSLDDDIMQY